MFLSSLLCQTVVLRSLVAFWSSSPSMCLLGLDLFPSFGSSCRDCTLMTTVNRKRWSALRWAACWAEKQERSRSQETTQKIILKLVGEKTNEQLYNYGYNQWENTTKLFLPSALNLTSVHYFSVVRNHWQLLRPCLVSLYINWSVNKSNNMKNLFWGLFFFTLSRPFLCSAQRFFTANFHLFPMELITFSAAFPNPIPSAAIKRHSRFTPNVC